jgi:hypothetical protein
MAIPCRDPLFNITSRPAVRLTQPPIQLYRPCVHAEVLARQVLSHNALCGRDCSFRIVFYTEVMYNIGSPDSHCAFQDFKSPVLNMCGKRLNTQCVVSESTDWVGLSQILLPMSFSFTEDMGVT